MFLIFIVLTGFFFTSGIGATCNSDSWHYDSIAIDDTIEMLMMVILTIIIQVKSKTDQEGSAGKKSLSHLEGDKRLLTQCRILTIFYVFATFTDWGLKALSKRNLKNGNLVCLDNIFVLAETKKGASYMLLAALLDFAYTLMIIFVFYEMPRRFYGQYTMNRGSILNIGDHMRGTMKMEEEQAKSLFTAIEEDKAFTQKP